jgi:hypothetical protein
LCSRMLMKVERNDENDETLNGAASSCNLHEKNGRFKFVSLKHLNTLDFHESPPGQTQLPSSSTFKPDSPKVVKIQK